MLTKLPIDKYIFISPGLLLILMIWTTLLFPNTAQAEKKVALIIGNSAYQSTTQLENPINDATKLSEAFESLGFRVIRGINMTKLDMVRHIQLFSRQMKAAEIAVFFYAGHGIQINAKNFLIPIDFDPFKASHLGSQLVSLDNILHEMEEGDHTSIIFLDACRDNPLADQLASNIAKGRSMKLDKNRSIDDVRQGLAKVEGKANTLIAYATQPGNTALDGTGLNSPFTGALLEYIKEPGLEIRDIMTKVRMQVMNETQGRQIPWDHSSLLKKVYFKKKKRWFAPPP